MRDCREHHHAYCWCEKGEKEMSIRVFVITFTFLLYKVQDGDGPVRASQESRDALHHPFHLIFFFRSHPAHARGRGSLGQTPRTPLKPFCLRQPRTEREKSGLRSRPAPWVKATNQLT